MRLSRRGASLLALAALMLPTGGASADELLVMPYACSMVGGQPVLTRGPEQSHRIIGERDQRKFTACSPVNPDMCRHWLVHRFDLNCDGTRVPWVSVVAATNEGSRNAWLLDGRLVLRMGPWWSLAPDDPCAREADPGDRFAMRRLRRQCADQLAMAPPPVVEMPYGYAPMLGIDGIFVKAAPKVGSAPPSLPPVAAAPPPPKPALPEPQVPQQTGPKVVSAAPAPSVAAPPAFQAPTVVPAEARPAPPEVVPPEPKPVSKGTLAAPKAAPEPPAAAPPKAVPAEGPREPARAAPAAPALSLEPAAEPGDSAFSVNLFSAFRTTTLGALVAFFGVAIGLLAAFALARRNERLRDARRGRRDLAAVSLGGKRGRTSGRNAVARQHPGASAAVSRASARSTATGGVADWGDRMPRNRTEAMQVLGMGVAPSATEAAMKKIVDGLRQSWHPDLAQDETERTLRELRSKQINAAWDLLRGQRAEV